MASGKPTFDALGEIALAAGAVILEVYARKDVPARIKADGSPVTQADARAEALILTRLRALAPDVPIVSEEAMADGRAFDPGPRFFLVDPLDGTKEFLSRNGEFTVNIALIEQGRPVMGVVHAPAHGLLFGGDPTSAFRAEARAGKLGDRRTIRARKPGATLDVVASRSHMTPETEAFLRRYQLKGMHSCGSSLKFCHVAEGLADLYPRLGPTMEWDTAAGDAVLRAAGGHVLALDGVPLTYGKRAQGFANPSFVACGDFDPFAQEFAAHRPC